MTPKQQRFYVYALFNPLTRRIFYIGKGSGDRAYKHEAEERSGKGCNVHKRAVLRKIRAAGLCPRVRFLRSGMTEDEAYALERRWIVRFHHRLTNIVSGTTTDKQRGQEQARYWLGRLRPFCEWVRLWPQLYGTDETDRRWIPVQQRLEYASMVTKGIYREAVAD